MTLQERLIAVGAIKAPSADIIPLDEGAISLRNLRQDRDLFNDEIKREIKNIKEIAPEAISPREEILSPIENKGIGSVNFANEQSSASTANRDIAGDVKGVMVGFGEPDELKDFVNTNKVIGFVNSSNEMSEANNGNKGNALNLNAEPAPEPEPEFGADGLALFEFYKIQADYFDNGKQRGRSQFTAKFHITPEASSSRKTTLVANFYSRTRDYWSFVMKKGVEEGPFYKHFVTRCEQIWELDEAGILNPEYETKLAILKEYALNPSTGMYEFQSLENSGVIAYWRATDDCPTIEVFLEGWSCAFKMDFSFERKKASSNLKFMGMYLNKGMTEAKGTKSPQMVRKTSF